MREQVEHSKNCIGELLNYLFFVMLELFVFDFFPEGAPGVFRFVIPLAIPLFFYLIRIKIRRFLFSLLFHIIPVLLLFIGYRDSVAQLFVFIPAAVIQGVLSFSIRITRQIEQINLDHPIQPSFGCKTIPPTLAVAAGTGYYLIRGIPAMIGVVFFFIILYFVYIYLTHFLYYMSFHKKTVGSALMKSIFGINFALVLGFVLISSLVIFLLADFTIFETILMGASGLLRRLMVFFISLLMRVFSGIGSGNMTEQETLPPEELFEYAPQEGSLLSSILNLLFHVAGAVILIAAAGALLYGLIKLIRLAFSRRLESVRHTVKKAEGDIIEKLERKTERGNIRHRQGLAGTPEDKIRKIVRKTLWKHYQVMYAKPKAGNQTGFKKTWKEINRCRTVRESFCLLSINGEAAQSLIYIYEKACYGKAACTREDVKEAVRLTGIL